MRPATGARPRSWPAPCPRVPVAADGIRVAPKGSCGLASPEMPRSSQENRKSPFSIVAGVTPDAVCVPAGHGTDAKPRDKMAAPGAGFLAIDILPEAHSSNAPARIEPRGLQGKIIRERIS